MNIQSLVDYCFTHKEILTSDIRYDIPKKFTPYEWVKFCNFFLSNLSKRHSIPGDVVHTMIGICQWYTEHKFLTHDQQIYLSNTIVDNWDQLDTSAFIQLNL
jgi:hypothetical protein